MSASAETGVALAARGVIKHGQVAAWLRPGILEAVEDVGAEVERVSGREQVWFGADDDPRTLAVTYSERVGPDPVAVWRDTVEPGLSRADAYQRIGVIEATTYQGREAADMEWITTDDGARVRTFGRGFLLGDGRGFSLRWTTPAADWASADSQEALRTVLRTFRPGTAS